MINLSLDELRLIAQIRNISDYENKSKEDLIKALSEPKPETKPKTKPEPKIKTKPEPKTKPKPEPELETEPKIKIRVNKKKLEEIEKDFYELMHKFCNKKDISIEKLFMT